MWLYNVRYYRRESALPTEAASQLFLWYIELLHLVGEGRGTCPNLLLAVFFAASSLRLRLAHTTSIEGSYSHKLLLSF
jgi:hypothetical protein